MYLVPLATGKKLGALGLTEPMAGSDSSSTRTTAVREGNDYIINGSKIFITNGYEADIYIVNAQMDKSKRNKGIAAFIMEKGTPGFTFAYIASQHKPVTKASAMAKLYASETAMWVTTQAVQILGGYGYTREYPVERMMRDAKITRFMKVQVKFNA